MAECSRRHVIGLLAAGVAFASPRARAAEDAWTLGMLGRALAEAPRGSRAFTEDRHLPYLEEPVRLSGRLEAPEPDRLEKHVTAPVEEHFIIDGSQVTLTREDGTLRRLSVFDHPLLRALADGLRRVLAGDMDAARRSFDLGLSGTRDDWRLTLYPSSEDLRRVLDVMRVEGSGGRVDRVEIAETAGVRTVMTLKDMP